MAYDEEFVRANPHVRGGGIRRMQSTVSRGPHDGVASAGPSGMPPGFGPGGPMMGPHGGGGGYMYPGMLAPLMSRSGGSTRAPGTRASGSFIWGGPGSVPIGPQDRGIAENMRSLAYTDEEEERRRQEAAGMYGGSSQGGYGGLT
jgi:hypothetical protein